jgi:NADH-ubiquinone oxidoreductase chain 4
MVLAGVLLKLGGYGIVRVLKFSLSLSYLSRGVFFSFGLIGSLLVCFICLRQSDFKSLVAYSSVSHMGFVLCGLFSFNFFGSLGSVFMLVSHGLCSSAMFVLLYVSYCRFHTRSLLVSKGMLLGMPLLGFWWFFFGALNMGVPPSLGFFSEVALVGRFLGNDYFSVFLVCLVLLFSCFYSVYFYVVGMHGSLVFSFVDSFVFVREFLILFAHLFPSFFLVVGGFIFS